MARLAELLGAAGAAARPRDHLAIDGLIAPGAATAELVERIAAAGPYGAGAPPPRIALASARILNARTVGTGHLALSVGDDLGGRLDAIAFRAFESELGPLLSARGCGGYHLAGRLECDHWGGRPRIKLHLDDAAPARHEPVTKSS
jgi:single-stranded-DNA-specific exonuclease